MANATQNHGDVGWVSEPSVRGTASLVFSCISTIAICTWTALHLDVPGTAPKRTYLPKLQLWIIALFVPEVVTMMAFEDWHVAHALTKEMCTFKTKDEWSSSLSHFVAMGGVVVRDETGEQMLLPPRATPEFVRNGWIDLQNLTPVMVADKSKADYFTKVIACLQTIWFLLQLIGRAASHLTVTTLELSALAYVFYALGAFGFWLQKPLDVHLPLIIHTSPTFTPAHKRKIQKEHRPFFDAGTTHVALFARLTVLPTAMLCCILFGGCHLLAWNAHFPSHVEHILWRVSSVSCVVLSLLMVFHVVIKEFEKAWLNQRLRWLASFESTLMVGIPILYIAVRSYLLFEAFFSLRSVSPDVYTAVPWAQYIPHL